MKPPRPHRQPRHSRRLAILKNPFARGALAGSPAVLLALVAIVGFGGAGSACGCGAPPKPEEREVVNGENPGFGPGYQPSPCTGKPVDCATGDLTETETDLSVGGRGPKLEVTRSYNSLVAVKAESSAWGYGWSGPYSAHLTINKEAETATVYQDDGTVVVFHSKGTEYVPEDWVTAKLAKSGTNYVYTLETQEQLEFNESGQLTKETDRDGNSLTFTYNAKNQLETVKDGAERTLTFTYNAEGLVESVKDPMGHTAKYTYEGGNLKTVTLPGEAKARWTFAYNASHQITSMTDGREHATKIEYETEHRVSSEKDPLERERKFSYKVGTESSETTITEPNGSKTVEKFNAAKEPTEVTRASGTELASTTKYEYNSSYQKTAMIDPDEHKTEYKYDEHGNLTSEKDANGNEKKWTYTTEHYVETETTPKGETTTIKRNAHGNPETIERTVGGKAQKTSYKYGEHEDLTEETNPLEEKTTFTYDAYGDKASETDAEGDERTWEYNKDGQEVAEVSPRGNALKEEAKYTTKTERDEQGRPIKVTDPLGHVTEYKYDGNGNVESVKDPDEHTTKYVYDADNERTKVEEPKSTTETEYDSEGQVKAQSNGNKDVTKYEHNALEEVTEETDPLTHKTKKKYDKAGNLTEVEDAEGRKTTYKYDPGNRLTEISYSEGTKPTVKYEYDADGDVTKMTDSTGETTYKYDEIDRMTESKDAHGDVVKYVYNLGNELTELEYPNGKTVTRAYDKADRLKEVKDWLGNTTTFKYNQDSLPSATVFPAGTKNEDTYAYNEADQMSEVKMLKEGAEAASLVYTRDKDGQVEKTVSKGLPKEGTVEYTNDEDKRLTKAGATTYEYDAANNPTKLGATTCTYNAGSEIEKCGETTYTYNNMGQRTKAEPKTASETVNYEYNQAGVLTGAKRETPEIKDTYAYNGNNLRVSETIKGATSYLAWDTAEQLPLLLNDGTNSYIYGPEGVPFEQINSSEEALYLHHDQQDSTRMLTNGTGEDKGAYTYDAYGNTEEHTGAASTLLEYDGQYTNADTGLIYLRAREYDPHTAQFMSDDLAVADTGAPYYYAVDNPINSGDSNGEQASAGWIPSTYGEWAPSPYNDGSEVIRIHGANGDVVYLRKGDVIYKLVNNTWQYDHIEQKPPQQSPPVPPTGGIGGSNEISPGKGGGEAGGESGGEPGWHIKFPGGTQLDITTEPDSPREKICFMLGRRWSF